jgi:hypothetical protein
MTEQKPEEMHLADPEAEEKMRAALERFGSSGTMQTSRPPSTMIRRRFAKDGEVQVEARALTEGGVNRLEAAQQALRAERDERLRVECDLLEAKATIETLTTKLGHAEMGLREAQEARAAAEQAMEAGSVQKAPEAAPEPEVAVVVEQPKRRPGRPRKGQEKRRAPEVEQEPIWYPHWELR